MSSEEVVRSQLSKTITEPNPKAKSMFKLTIRNQNDLIQ